MNFVDIMKDILVYAPTIASILVIKDAGTVLTLLADIFDVLDGDNDALHTAIANDPDRAEKLKKLEYLYNKKD